MNPIEVHAVARIDVACKMTGETRSTLYAKAKAGLLPVPIKIGPRAAAVPLREIAAINAARIRGEGDDAIRALVNRLHLERATLGV